MGLKHIVGRTKLKKDYARVCLFIPFGSLTLCIYACDAHQCDGWWCAFGCPCFDTFLRADMCVHSLLCRHARFLCFCVCLYICVVFVSLFKSFSTLYVCSCADATFAFMLLKIQLAWCQIPKYVSDSCHLVNKTECHLYVIHYVTRFQWFSVLCVFLFNLWERKLKLTLNESS